GLFVVELAEADLTRGPRPFESGHHSIPVVLHVEANFRGRKALLLELSKLSCVWRQLIRLGPSRRGGDLIGSIRCGSGLDNRSVSGPFDSLDADRQEMGKKLQHVGR